MLVFTVMSSSRVSSFTEGVISKVTDLALLAVFYQLEFVANNSRTLSDANHAGEKALDDLARVNYQSIKRALIELKKKGLVKTFTDSYLQAEITSIGKKRLASLVPQYQKRRPWDGNLYLVTYDVPVAKNYERDLLREYLKKIGCGLLQESIWVTPYNPAKIVEEFVSERDLEGTVLVSLIGKDGSIGKLTLEELIEKVYGLEDLNERYKEFINECKLGEVNKTTAAFKFWSILEDDPQLPFELLPDWWEGDRAYSVFSKLMKRKG